MQVMEGHWVVPWDTEKLTPFAECPYPTCAGQNNGSNCSTGSMGAVCAICKPEYHRTTTGTCDPCSVASSSARIGALATLVLFLLFLYFMYHVCQRKIERLKNKAERAANQYADALALALDYGADGMKIFVVFWQISSASPGILDLPFPPIYKDFLAFFSFVNFDVLGLLGLDCVGDLDYRVRVALSCMLPVLVVGCSAIVYLKNKFKHLSTKKGLRKYSHKEREDAISSLFDLVDADNSGYIEINEFKMLLRELTHKRLDLSHVEHVMTRIIGVDQHTKNPILRLPRQQFIDAALSGNIADTNADEWVQYVQINRERSQIFSTAFQLLGLIHAPVSSKLFNYFDCHDISGRFFLREDYSLECYEGGHQSFQFVVYLFLGGFTFGLPLALATVLALNRNTLRTPKVMERFGFLYDSYKPGAEYWDIHELLRRLMLTGMLLFLPRVTRLAASLLVTIASTVMLFGVKPHTADVIQRLEQSSFLILTFKYVGSVLLLLKMQEEETAFVGTVFILLDAVYMTHSFICLGSVVHDVWKAANGDDNEAEEGQTKKAAGSSSVSVVPVSQNLGMKESKQLRKEIAALKLQKKIQQTLQGSVASGNLKTVEDIETNHQHQRDRAMKKIQRRQTESHNSVELRLKARKKVKHSNALLKSMYFSTLDKASVSKIVDEMEFLVIKENNYEICRQGDDAHIFYIIIAGACRVTMNGKAIALLGEMDIFGESALFTDGNGQSKRGATVSTINDEIENVKVLALRRRNFQKLLASGTLAEDCLSKLKQLAEDRKKENKEIVVLASTGSRKVV